MYVFLYGCSININFFSSFLFPAFLIEKKGLLNLLENM